ncbi:MAG TPA: ABC transporter ATP-binding protein [Candidatus Xenobia bacterium]
MLLEVRDLKKNFPSPDGDENCIIDIPSFDLEARCLAGLEGTSGSGKTTFLNLLAGILKPTTGRISLDGVDITGLAESRRDRLRATSIGYIFQTFNLLQGYSVLENVLLAMSFAGRVDIDFATHLLTEVGLQHRLNYRPSQLSTGQQQRVATARALANRPRLVLADEPTGNLDPKRAADAITLIQELSRENQASLLLVSHDQKVLSQFSQIYQLSDLNRTLAAVAAS